MYVSDLIERLQKCDPNAIVLFAYVDDNPISGTPVSEFMEIKFHDEKVCNEVVLRG